MSSNKKNNNNNLNLVEDKEDDAQSVELNEMSEDESIEEDDDNFENEEEEVEEDKEDDLDFYNKENYIEIANLAGLDGKEHIDLEEKDLIKQSEEYKNKVKKSGVIYISYIPEGLTVSLIRKKLEKYGVRRIYLAPISGKKNHFKEGWIEFENKIMAKLCEYELNGQKIGGKKRESISEEMWTFKYLHKFKWHHLVEKVQLQQKVKEQELKTAISQAHRENQFILESHQQSYNKKKKLENTGEENKFEKFAKTVKQKKAILKK